MRLPKIATLSLVFVLLISSFGVAAANHSSGQADDWCLSVGAISEDTSDQCGLDTVSRHDKVDMRLQRTSPAGKNDVYFLPTMEIESRQDGRIVIELEQNGNGVVADKELNFTGGEEAETKTAVLIHNRNSGGLVSDGEYSVQTTLYNADGEIVAQKSVNVREFYIGNTATDTVNSSDGTSGTGGGIVVPEGVDVRVDEVVSDVSRYNDGTNDSSRLQDTSIPPIGQSPGTQFGSGIGTLKSFDAMRERENPTLNDGTIRSVGIDGDQLIEFGTVTYGIPQAKEHRLVVTYSMQTIQPTEKGIGVEIVDSTGEVIDKDKELGDLSPNSSRWLSDTVKSSVDRTQDEQLINADENILNERSVTINLTEEEEQYINNNYEAYVVYRTEKSGSPGGVTIFKPFRSAIYSTDATNVDFEYNPEKPSTGDSIQFSVNSLPENFYDPETDTVGVVRWKIGGNEIAQNVTKSDFDTLRNNPDATLAGPTRSYSDGGAKRATLVVETPEGTELQHTETFSVFGQGEVEDTPATFDVGYSVLNQINARYGTVDIPPTKHVNNLNSKLRLKVTVDNTGNSEIRRKVALVDTLEGEFGYQKQIRDTKTVRIEPQSTASVRLSTDWYPEEYGKHKITVVEYINGNPQEVKRKATGKPVTRVYVEQPATLDVENIITPKSWFVYDNFDARVQIVNIGDLSTDHPASTVELEGEFADDWQGGLTTKEIPTLAGGNARAGTAGASRTILFDSGEPYTPSYPGMTQNKRDQINSPWGDQVGENQDLTFRTIHKFASDNPARQEQLNDSLTKGVDLYKMNIFYFADATDPSQGDKENPSQVRASAYPFTRTHYTSSLTQDANNYSNDLAIPSAGNSNAIPTTGITRFEQVSKAPQQVPTISVSVDNPRTGFDGTARVKVVSDRKVYYPDDWNTSLSYDNRKPYEWFPQGGGPQGYSDKVVGVASVDMEAFQTRGTRADSPRIKVPVIIPNHPQNQGQHELEVKVRHSPDYIQKYEQYESDSGAFTERMDVTVWGDSMYIGYKNNNPGSTYEQEIYQNCTSGQSSGLGKCLNSGETRADIDFTYQSVGGAPITQTMDVHFWHTQPGDLVSNLADVSAHHKTLASYRNKTQQLNTKGGVAIPTLAGFDLQKSNSEFFQQNPTQTFGGSGSPREYQTWTFNGDFEEPGRYIIHPTQYRVTESSSDFPSYHTVGIDRDKTFGPQSSLLSGEHRVELMVWDDRKPEARFHMQDCTSRSADSSNNFRDASYTGSSHEDVSNSDTGISYSQCLENEYNGLGSFSEPGVKAGNRADFGSVAWQGGTIRFDAGARSDMFNPEQSDNLKIASDNVGVDSYEWSIYKGSSAGGTDLCCNRSSSTTSSAVKHRFNDSGTYTVELTVTDLDGYVKNGDHSATVTETFQIANDSSFGISISGVSVSYNEGVNSIGGTRDVWSSGEHTDGAQVTWDATTDEEEIGTEQLQWTASSGSIDATGNFTKDSSETYDTQHNGLPYGSYTANVTVEAEDFAGNVDDATDSLSVTSDGQAPSYSCSPSDCYSYAEDSDFSDGSSTYASASTTTCVTFTEEGPSGGIGFYKNGGTHCVTASASASSSANADPSTPSAPSCSCGESKGGETNCASDSSPGDSDTTTRSRTITAEDYHGNQTTVTIEAEAFAEVGGTSDSECVTGPGCTGDPCPDPPDNGGGGGGGCVVDCGSGGIGGI